MLEQDCVGISAETAGTTARRTPELAIVIKATFLNRFILFSVN
jgi:hypothetical protein